MRFDIITLFPEFFASPLHTTMLQKGQERGVLDFRFFPIRDYASGKHRVTDDTPYGGGAGMVMKVEPVVRAIEAAGRPAPPYCVLLTPQGEPLTPALARELAGRDAIALVAGRYEGVDERVRDFVDAEISVGDYVLSGGEVAALVVIEVVSRFVPGVLGGAASAQEESFAGGLLEYPQYTRPLEFRHRRVPEILLSGNHAGIARWRRQQALLRTARRRPDLLREAKLSAAERRWLQDRHDG